MPKNFRKICRRAWGERKSFPVLLRSRAPFCKTRDRLRGQLGGAHEETKIAVWLRPQVPARYNFAVFDECHLIASDFDFAEQMRIEKNSCPSFALRTNHVAHQPSAHWIEARSGLVEKNQFWLMNQ